LFKTPEKQEAEYVDEKSSAGLANCPLLMSFKKITGERVYLLFLAICFWFVGYSVLTDKGVSSRGYFASMNIWETCLVSAVMFGTGFYFVYLGWRPEKKK